MERNTFVKACDGEEDWQKLKNVFVRAFRKYPLFTYIVPDETKREEFLDKFLEAHYDITVRHGNSILLCIATTNDGSQQHEGKIQSNIVGGVLFLQPAKNGIGWEHECEDYISVYKKYQLDVIDQAAFERLIKFEDWEEETITSKLFALGIPLWNGMFCAIDPAHSSNGCGSSNYEDCIKFITQLRLSELKLKYQTKVPQNNNKYDCSTNSTKQRAGTDVIPTRAVINDQTRSLDLRWKLLPSLSFLSHVPFSVPVPKSPEFDKLNVGNVLKKVAADLPLLAAVTHSKRAVAFHEKHGFQLVLEVPHPVLSSESSSKFTHYVLLCDPFGSGKLKEAAMRLRCLTCAMT